MKTTNVSRRALLKGMAAAGTGAALAGTASAQDADDTAGVQAGDIQCAERLMGVDYTDDERAQMAGELDDYLTRLKARRAAVILANDDAPALTFTPFLSGSKNNPQNDGVRISRISVSDQPGSDVDIAFAPIAKQGYWLRGGLVTSARLTDIYLERIARLNPVLNNFITPMADTARAQAAQADAELAAGNDRGPLHGIPYALKDLADTQGVKTTWGATPYQDRMPDEDAVIVSRLREAGAVLLGKASLGALAYGDKWFDAVTRNPWAPEEGSSGSSAGSASATAAGMCGFSIGTETLGSIVSPSTRCGVTGLRPTFGRVPRTGTMALCWSLDKFGPICRFTEDTALVLAAINGADAGDASSHSHGFSYNADLDLSALTVGYDPAWFKDATPTDQWALEQVRKSGATLQEITLPDLPYQALFTVVEAEAAAAFEDLTLSNRDDMLAWQEARAWPNTFRAARFHSAVELIQIDRFRRRVMAVMDDVYNQVDMLISPNFAGSLLIITNFTGHPSLTLPLGMEERETEALTGVADATSGPARRLPHTITLWGGLLGEGEMLSMGRYLEQRANFSRYRPQVAV